MLAKTVTILLTLCLASEPPGFTGVAEPGYGRATPVVFCFFLGFLDFWGRSLVSLLAALDRGWLASRTMVPEWPCRRLMVIRIHSVRVAGKNRVKVARMQRTWLPSDASQRFLRTEEATGSPPARRGGRRRRDDEDEDDEGRGSSGPPPVWAVRL